jgi:glycosyltransferase involved in cell wall biosynthesis
MSRPFISICIPAYNARRYLPATLASVRAQTCADWELIVTEDGSREPVADLVRAFAQKVPQAVVYQRHEHNKGLPATRNTGIAAARGRWIALLDSDDLWTPDHLTSLVACARRHPAADLVHAGSVLFDSKTGADIGIRAPSAAAVRAFPRSLYLADYIVQPSSVLMKKSLWTRVGGFNPDYRNVSDRELWLRCARAGATFAYSGGISCRYRKHAAAISTHAGPMALHCARVLDQHLDWQAIDPACRHRVTAEAWTSAGRIVLRRKPHLARTCFARAWRVRRSPRVACYWLAACLIGRATPH